MLTEQWGLAPPHLVVALVGGDELAQMKPWLRDTVRKGLVKAAQSTGAWILTNGLRFGITKHLGQAVRDHSLASTSSKVKVVAIGIAPWNMIHHRDALLAAKPDQPAVVEPQDLPHGAVYSLDCNHSHFVLVEEDPQRPGATRTAYPVTHRGQLLIEAFTESCRKSFSTLDTSCRVNGPSGPRASALWWS
nr:transient receptor potential cation channel subfamily M member 5-like [Salvelinus alpinus]